MKKEEMDRESSLERLMRDALQRRVSEVSDTSRCLDADTLAAWAEGTLSARDRAALEAHAADCARCQAMLAAMVRTTPAPAEAAWWRVHTMAWIVPVTAAAAIVVLAVLPSMRSTTAVPPRAAEQVAQATPPATPPAPSFDRSEKETPNLDRFRQQPLRRADASNEKLTKSTLAKTEAPPVPKLQAQSAADETRKNEMADARVKELAKDAPTPPPAAAPAPPPPPAPAPAAAAPLPTAAAPAQARERQPLDTVTGAGGAVVGGIATPRGERNLLASRAAAVPGAPIVSPNPLNRWRLLPGGTVQRSTDGGATWQTQSTGVSVTLTAGASPAPLVCWLAGPGGRVLLTVDGATWKQVSLGQPIDLVAIRAVDDKSATVTAADGRTFATADAGATWTPR